MEDVEKRRHAEDGKQINQRPQKRHRRNHVIQDARNGPDEIRRQENRQQKRSDQRQECCILEGHGRSMDAINVWSKRQARWGVALLRPEPYAVGFYYPEIPSRLSRLQGAIILSAIPMTACLSYLFSRRTMIPECVEGRVGLDIGEIQVQSDQDTPLCPDTASNDCIVRSF